MTTSPPATRRGPQLRYIAIGVIVVILLVGIFAFARAWNAMGDKADSAIAFCEAALDAFMPDYDGAALYERGGEDMHAKITAAELAERLRSDFEPFGAYRGHAFQQVEWDYSTAGSPKVGVLFKLEFEAGDVWLQFVLTGDEGDWAIDAINSSTRAGD